MNSPLLIAEQFLWSLLSNIWLLHTLFLYPGRAPKTFVLLRLGASASYLHQRQEHLSIISPPQPHSATMASTSTYTMEAPAQPVELQDVSHYITKPNSAKLPTSSLKINETSGSRLDEDDGRDPVENLPSPTTQAAEKLERWNTPRVNFWRTMAAFWSFVVMGSNDAAYGVCIDSILVSAQ